MPSAGLLFAGSIVAFSLLAWVFGLEDKRGRLILPLFRNKLDEVLDKVVARISHYFIYLARHIIQLSWYYSIHKMLRFILSLLIKVYDFIEDWFMANRARAKAIKLEKKRWQGDGHLTQVAEHKAAVSLTAAEKKKLLKSKLDHG